MVELEGVPLFRGSGKKELQDLKEISVEKRFSAGAEIFREGDPGNGLYVIKDGSVEIVHLVEGSDARHVFSQLGPGEIFGEMAVIELRPRSATAVAAKDTIVYFLPREEMRMLLQHAPTLSFKMLEAISHRLRDFNQRHLRQVVDAERLALIGRFAQGIVHDLKNPLSIIGLSSELFGMPGVSEEVRAKTQERIRRQIARINEMIGDILIFTENRKRENDIIQSDFRKFIFAMLNDLRPDLEIKAIEIQLENDPPPVSAPLDTRRLGRVFHNLINNATDFMLDGGKIFLRFKQDEKEIVVEIEDTGPGIAPEIVDKLFQPFATHGKSHGTGLGLSICKKIIEDHGGKIWAQNKAGHGAVFCFSLPLKPSC
ncbi:MAG TPA: ATP-binding protein [Verrucomicrobiae bacterium]|nr:ATP-binding protein [Verrucomicrobiae bacterium]